MTGVDVEQEDPPSRRHEALRRGNRVAGLVHVLKVPSALEILLAVLEDSADCVDSEGFGGPQDQDVADLRRDGPCHGSPV
jgi:hypothetical protein